MSNLSQFKDKLKAFDDFKNKQHISNVFWYVKVCIFWKCIQYIVHWDKTHILKRFSSDKINATKNVLFFLSRALTHHSFTFNLQVLYDLILKFLNCLKLSGRFSTLDSVSFILKFIFLFNKMHGLFDFKT